MPLASRSRSLGLIAVVAVAVGCSQQDPYRKVKVSGQVLYEDGEAIPVGSIAIRFDSTLPPVDAKTHPRPGFAFTDADGSFASASTKGHDDGIVVGKHRVSLGVADGAPGAIPAVYQAPQTSPLEIDTAELPLEIRIARPEA
ncbi:MAG: hypothetical protein AAF266_05095 [Planctomycetota bacterium]